MPNSVHLICLVALALIPSRHAAGEEGSPPPSEPYLGPGEERALISQWFSEGTAAGHIGDAYDNRDSGHSTLRLEHFPQLRPIDRSGGPDPTGLAFSPVVEFPLIRTVLGNCSMAVVEGDLWRSLPRLAYTNGQQAAILHAQYRANRLYLYPEHRDHDPGHNGRPPAGVRRGEGGYGDLYPANTPYLVISQGSSGSDQPFLRAFALTLASFRPEVKDALCERGELMPTLQRIFRRSNAGIDDAAYFTGDAHPTVFDAAALRPKAMMRRAQRLRLGRLPPLAVLEVVEEETESILGSDRLFDTPHAIARVHRTPERFRRVVVSLAGSRDPQDRELTFHARILRGDADAIVLRTIDEENGSIFEALIPWHERFPVSEGSDLESNRVDIGFFADNGVEISAPAFLTTYYPDAEWREYDSKERLRILDHLHPKKRDLYVDPVVQAARDWRDEFDYDEDGKLIGWSRTDSQGQTTRLLPPAPNP